MFIWVAPRGPRCPHTQQCVEKTTAGHNTSHISWLSHMAVLGWSWFLPHLPSHLSFRSLFFQLATGCLWALIVLPHHSHCQTLFASMPSFWQSCAHNKPALLHSVQGQLPYYLYNLSPPSLLRISASILPGLAQGHIWNEELLLFHPIPPFCLFADGLLIWKFSTVCWMQPVGRGRMVNVGGSPLRAETLKLFFKQQMEGLLNISHLL